jgi:uncharacterized protein (TIGR02265 family)
MSRTIATVFKEPDWTASIDFAARIAAVPERAKVRGMFFQSLIQAMGESAPEDASRRRYVAFKNYPMREYVELMMIGCARRSKHQAAGEYVRRLGRNIYPSYAQTISGTAIFAAAGRNFRRVLELCPAAYRIVIDPGSVAMRSITDGHAVVELRDIWNLPDLHQVGIFEGALDVCAATGTIEVNVIDFGAVDFEIRWRQA